LALCAAALAAAFLRASPAAAAEGDREYVVSFKSRTYTDPEKGFICLPRECLSYVKFHSPAKPRPLFAAGWGKEGLVKVKFVPTEDMAVMDSKGTGIVEFTEFAAGASAEAADFACSDWARQPPDNLVVKISRIEQWAEEGNRMKALSEAISVPRWDKPAPKPAFKAVADIEIACGTRSAALSKLPVRVDFSFEVAEMWGMVRLYWLMTVTASGSFRGDALGLTGADAGDVKFDLVAAGLRALPPTHKAADAVNMDADGTTASDLGVSHE
jgi:hypothetical protein